MIVQEPPYDLVALFSDLEMQKLFEALLERGQTQGRDCTRPFRWRSLRDPRRDTVWSQPEASLLPFLRTDCRFLILWDHHGSGHERLDPSEAEERVAQRLESVGVTRNRILAVAFDPELECLFRRIWPRVKEVITAERGGAVPEDVEVLAEAYRSHPELRSTERFEDVLSSNPKELFEALVRLIRLRRTAPLYEKIGAQVSLQAMKREETALRIAKAVSIWLPPESV